MGNLTRNGRHNGYIPATAGNVYWVSPSANYIVDGRYCDASDGNDGLSPDKALRRVNRAWALVTANQGDVIVLLPGDHSAATSDGTATSIAASTAGVTMMGMNSGKGNPYRKRTTLTVVAADETMNITAADIEIVDITFLGDALNTATAIANFSSAAHRLHIHDCTVDVTAQTAGTSILGFDATGAAQNVLIEDVVFHVDGAFGVMIDMTATVDSVIRRILVSLQTGTYAAAISAGASTDRLQILGSQFNCGAGTMSKTIIDTGTSAANGIYIADNICGVNTTKFVDDFSAGEAVINNNYIFTIGGGTGGTLVAAIT